MYTATVDVTLDRWITMFLCICCVRKANDQMHCLSLDVFLDVYMYVHLGGSFINSLRPFHLVTFCELWIMMGAGCYATPLQNASFELYTYLCFVLASPHAFTNNISSLYPQIPRSLVLLQTLFPFLVCYFMPSYLLLPFIRFGPIALYMYISSPNLIPSRWLSNIMTYVHGASSFVIHHVLLHCSGCQYC